MHVKATFIYLIMLIVSNLVGLEGESFLYNSKYTGDSRKEYVKFSVRESKHSDKQLTRAGIVTMIMDAPATILICHGFMCDKSDVSFLRLLFKRFNTFMFDFRAHGDLKKDQCCTFGFNESYDIIGAVKYIKSRPELKDKPVIVYAFSMGAVASILAQSREKNLFDAMILDCPFESSDDVINRGLDNLYINFFGCKIPMPFKSLLKQCVYHPYTQSVVKYILKTITPLDSMDVPTCIFPVYPIKAAQKIIAPCLFIACKHDDRAPVHAVKKVFQAIKGPKRLWITNGRRHYDSIFYNLEKYGYKINSFIDKVLDKRWNTKKNNKTKIDLESF